MSNLAARVRYHAKKAGVEIHVGHEIGGGLYVDVHSEDPLDVNNVQNAIANGLGGDYYVTNPAHHGTVRRLHIGHCEDQQP